MIFDQDFQNFLPYYKVFQPIHCICPSFYHLILTFYHNSFFTLFIFFFLYQLVPSPFILFFLIALIYNLLFDLEGGLTNLFLMQLILFFILSSLLHFNLIQISLFLFFIIPFHHLLHHIEPSDLFELINLLEKLIFAHFHQHNFF